VGILGVVILGLLRRSCLDRASCACSLAFSINGTGTGASRGSGTRIWDASLMCTENVGERSEVEAIVIEDWRLEGFWVVVVIGAGGGARMETRFAEGWEKSTDGGRAEMVVEGADMDAKGEFELATEVAELRNESCCGGAGEVWSWSTGSRERRRPAGGWERIGIFRALVDCCTREVRRSGGEDLGDLEENTCFDEPAPGGAITFALLGSSGSARVSAGFGRLESLMSSDG
jgi:hypothetical protein